MSKALNHSLVAVLLTMGLMVPLIPAATRASWEPVGGGRDATIDYGALIGLSLGDEGAEVEALQRYLQMAGHLSEAETNPGVFDQLTAQALAAFQAHHQLTDTGTVTEETYELLTRPRFDDLPDIDEPMGDDRELAYVLGRAWSKTNLTYAFKNYTPDISQQAQRAAIREAFDAWMAVTPLVITEISSTTQADIVVSFESGAHGDPCGPPSACEFDGRGGTLAHAFFPPPNGGSIAGDTHFDEDEIWTVAIPAPQGYIDLKTVAIHEFGHALGLGHSSVSGAIMYPYYRGADHDLHSDDIAGIQKLYGQNPNAPATIDAEVVSISMSPTSVTTGASVTGSVQVRNNGSAAASIPVTVSGPGGFSQNLTASNLGAGATATLSFTWTASGTGSFTFTATANLSGDINAANNSKTSNTVTVKASQTAPTQLYTKGITVTASGSGSSRVLKATVTVGPSASAASGARVYGRWTLPSGQQTTVNSLANSSGVVTFQLTSSLAGAFTFQVESITKTGYGYNAALNVGNPASITVGSAAAPPSTIDASVNQVTASPTSLKVNGGNVSIVATVANNSTKAASIPVTISGPGSYSSTKNVSVAAGASAKVTFTWPATVTGTHTFVVATSLSGDSNPANDQRTSPTVTVTGAQQPSPKVDAGITALTGSPSSVQQNAKTVTLTATVKNYGTASATISVRLTSATAAFDETKSVTVAAGATKSVQFQWLPKVTGKHTFTATSQLSGDSNATNNSRTTSITVTAPAKATAKDIAVKDIRTSKTSNGWTVYIDLKTSTGGSANGATVYVTVKDPSGKSTRLSAKANSQGTAKFSVQRQRTGTYTITVDDIKLSGYTYNSSLNQVRSKSLT